jgi:regulator of nonsense transcripts 2
MEALEKGKVTARTGAGGKVSSQMPAAPHFIAKKPAGDQLVPPEGESSAVSPLVGGEGIAFKLFKRGNKGRQEEVQLIVPKDTNLARRVTKQDDAAAKERDLLKARVLQYEAESRESADASGNVYLDESKLQVIRNRPLTIETINKNFGKRDDAPSKVSERLRGRGPGQGLGRGRGAGRLFNPGGGRG